jgi:hypothetical protein
MKDKCLEAPVIEREAREGEIQRKKEETQV